MQITLPLAPATDIAAGIGTNRFNSAIQFPDIGDQAVSWKQTFRIPVARTQKNESYYDRYTVFPTYTWDDNRTPVD